jgi:peptidyl-dipeptidase A
MNQLTKAGRGSVAAAVALALSLSLAPEAARAAEARQESADEFVARLNTELKALGIQQSTAEWVQATYITDDTQQLAALAKDRYLAYFTRAVEDAKRYQGQTLPPATARAIGLLKQQVSAPAPRDPAKREELTTLLTRLEATYGAGKWCPPSKDGAAADPSQCRNIDDLTQTLAKSRDYAELTEAWRQWHTISVPMRADYARFVELANEGARELGYADLGAMWRSGYDMTPEQFAAEADRLWRQVRPLYEQMHCYARTKLAAKYGEDKVPAGQPIPAQLLGNMWAQQWNKVYDLLEPYPGASDLDTDAALVKQGYDPVKMARSSEQFYTSLGFPKLPETFWTKSMLVRPRDRDVVCHASAWSMDTKDDVRIKMCTQVNYEDLQTLYHEMGHVYYYLMYRDQPYLFQSGAHDGFHEAIGDTVTLSMTPAYLQRIGLVQGAQQSQQALINQQMRQAVDKIAFLPFGKQIDEWRWRVFSGEVKPDQYNSAWWAMRLKYQGVAPPVARTEQDFDPGAKYHVPGNTPYTRYFLSYILQFQFHQALCRAAGFQGPLHECSVYGNDEAGRRFRAMLAAGASEPWQDTLEKLTGTRKMDAGPILEYFAPLQAWLKKENRGKQCGWDGAG